jgi:hypothetical protein
VPPTVPPTALPATPPPPPAQDLHTGTVTSPSPSTWGLYFSGHLVLGAVLDALVAGHGLQQVRGAATHGPSQRALTHSPPPPPPPPRGGAQATDIIVTGQSAGGIATWNNVDYVAERFPAARVTAVPVAGFYFTAYPYSGTNATTSYLANFTAAGLEGLYTLWSSHVDATCQRGLAATPWLCLLANNSFPFIASAAFAIEALTDKVVILDHDSIPQEYITLPPEAAYVAQWRGNMTTGLGPLLDPANKAHGAFAAACFIHTDFYESGPFVGGSNFLQAASAWYAGSLDVASYKLIDTCAGFACNPSCPS